MEEFIARENIKRFQAQLDTCGDESKRRVLVGLLEAEQRHLEEITRNGVAAEGSGSEAA